jgi:hypothetical protein
MMLNADFFASEVEFISPPQPVRRDGPSWVVGRWGCGLATAFVLTLPPAQTVAASEAWIVPSVIFRSEPSSELTPQVVALYREAALEDRDLAEAGLADFGLLVRNADET